MGDVIRKRSSTTPDKPRKRSAPLDVRVHGGHVYILFGEQLAGLKLSPEDARKWGDRLLTFAETAEEQADG
jgi:hypothetical protein